MDQGWYFSKELMSGLRQMYPEMNYKIGVPKQVTHLDG